MRISPVFPLLFVMAATLAACDHNVDAIARLDRIPFGGSNQANIAAMVANPADLIRGRGENSAVGQEASAPIDRLQTDRQKLLLNPGHSVTTGGGSGG
jgi:type IV pilus biogenesis protein CpaD/CtpE